MTLLVGKHETSYYHCFSWQPLPRDSLPNIWSITCTQPLEQAAVYCLLLLLHSRESFTRGIKFALYNEFRDFRVNISRESISLYGTCISKRWWHHYSFPVIYNLMRTQFYQMISQSALCNIVYAYNTWSVIQKTHHNIEHNLYSAHSPVITVTRISFLVALCSCLDSRSHLSDVFI